MNIKNKFWIVLTLEIILFIKYIKFAYLTIYQNLLTRSAGTACSDCGFKEKSEITWHWCYHMSRCYIIKTTYNLNLSDTVVSIKFEVSPHFWIPY